MSKAFILALHALLVWAAVGCASPLVGLECQRGYDRCGNACYDLANSDDHCGECGRSCGPGAICVEATCIPGSRDDAGTGGWTVSPPLCATDATDPECTCNFGELKCGTSCVDSVRDAENCGECGQRCDPEDFCQAGACTADCDPPLVACGASCVDPKNDIYSCGGCGNVCASGLCNQGQCLGQTAGHVILIGHPMGEGRPAVDRLAGNAIFLPNADPLRILSFQGDAAEGDSAGVRRAIASYAAATGRTFELTESAAIAIPALLSVSDVLVLNAQARASDEVLQKNAAAWGPALSAFVSRGGTIVLFDGQAGHSGSSQLLSAIVPGRDPLYRGRGRRPLSRKEVELVDKGDALATGVTTTYVSTGGSVVFDTDEQRVVVRDPESGLPVVVHITR
jgi:hypothetical protein